MKYIDEYRDSGAAEHLARHIARIATRPWTIMEICGGQTHAIVRFGIDALLPDQITLAHGPGCPVCVTPLAAIDRALALAALPRVILCSFGDMLRVPGSRDDLLALRARGADVRIVYSPLDAVAIARANPAREVVFFAVGFETTAPANAMAVLHARRDGVANFSLLVAHVLVPPAVEAILSSPGNRIDAFLAAGHVCTITGIEQYAPLAERYGVPIVVTGFEPLDILRGVADAVEQLEDGRADVVNAYARVVRNDGNAIARAAVAEVFRVADRQWRGLGTIERSGLELAPTYAGFDAARRFALDVETSDDVASSECRAGDVLRGQIKPHDCRAFGMTCTPERPLGAPMVSSEGACAAYYRYRGVERS
jgi:hydrogenase expression/formation protein HypD